MQHVAARHVERVIDTTATGDAFAGGYLAARLAGYAPTFAAGLGNGVAAVVIQHPGAHATWHPALPAGWTRDHESSVGGVMVNRCGECE
jgi:sugar/nucleoside kinase (ribokinase family)